jgi:hypothetical protein
MWIQIVIVIIIKEKQNRAEKRQDHITHINRLFEKEEYVI